ncbi:MAG: hypothetical protein ABIZ04_16005 [Opitutus sp.]
MADDPKPKREKLEPGQHTFERVNAPLSEEKTEPIKVDQILRDNLRVREETKPFELDLRRQTSRRKRDYLLLLAGGNALIVLAFSFAPKDPLLRVLCWSSLALYSLGLTWLMWGVMDDY